MGESEQRMGLITMSVRSNAARKFETSFDAAPVAVEFLGGMRAAPQLEGVVNLTGRRVARAVAPDTLVVTELPELRIVPDDLWQAAKAHQVALDRKGAAPGRETSGGAFWAKQRPRYLVAREIRAGQDAQGDRLRG